MALQQFDEIIAGVDSVQADSTYGTAVNAISTGRNRGSRVDAFYLGNSDTIDHLVMVQMMAFGTVTVLGTVNVPAGAGFTMAGIEALSALLPVGQQFVQLPYNVSLGVTIPVAINAPYEVDITSFRGDF